MRTSCFVKRRTVHRTRTGSPFVARMAMPKISVDVPVRIADRAKIEAERLWPRHGKRALNRLATDALVRYRSYCNDTTRPRTKHS